MRSKFLWLIVATALASTCAGKTLAQAQPLDITAELIANDPKDSVRTNSVARIFTYKMEQGRSYQIDMKSKDFDSYLRLENPAGVQVAFDDDSGGFPDARIIYKAQETGTFKIVATTYAGGAGRFTLTVRDTTSGVAAPQANQLQFTDGKATFKGSEDLQGFGSLTFILGQDGKVAMIDAKSTVGGTWTQAGRSLTIRFNNCEYTGQLNGTDFEGTAKYSDGSRTWSFRMHSALAPRPAADQSMTVKGTWVGSENLAGFGALTLVLGENGRVTMVDAKATETGNWVQNGRSVTITFSNCVYTGQTDGADFEGSAHYTEGEPRSWSFRMHKR